MIFSQFFLNTLFVLFLVYPKQSDVNQLFVNKDNKNTGGKIEDHKSDILQQFGF